MRTTPRLLVTALAVSLLAAAGCTDDDQSTPASTTPGSTAPGTAAPDTTAPGTTEPETTEPDTTGPDDHEHPSCIYRSGLLLARGVDGDPQTGGLAQLQRLDGAAVVETLGMSDVPGAAAAFDQLARDGVAVFQIGDPDADPLVLAPDLTELNQGAPFAPVLLTTISGHWTYAPGEPPVDGVDPPANVPAEAADADGPVAVVDTGYVDPTGAELAWLAARVEPVDASVDAERGLDDRVRGHGMFVGSLIAQEAPLAAVDEVRLTNDDAIPFHGELPEGIETGFASDELQLYVAVHRLLATGKEYQALNLSLGSYACDPERGASGLAIEAAVDRWHRERADTPIIAAAGNHDPASAEPVPPFLPAALAATDPLVFSVASTDIDTQGLSAFSNAGTVTAPGRDLVGVRDPAIPWSTWSGSSFATAIATAWYLRTGAVASVPQLDAVESR